MLLRLLSDWWRQRRDTATDSQPEAALALYREGVALGEDNRHDEAEDRYRRALLLDPRLAEAHNNYGRIHELRGRNAEAAESYRRAIACKPSLPQPHVNLGNLLQRRNELDAAYEQYEIALALDPGCWEAENNRTNIMVERGEHEAARAAVAGVAASRPDDPVAASHRLNRDFYDLASSPELLFQEYLAWGKRYADPLTDARPVLTNSPDPGRRLRLGYVSPDFRRHAMGFFIEPLLVHADATAFEVTCYNNWPNPADSMAARFRTLAHRWRDIAFVDDAELARQIAADGIDLLVDLAGHTAGNRLLAFARKPAPLQFTYLGYPNTTGVAAIDYRISDALADPPGMTEAFHTETLLRLPGCWCCYRAPDDAPDIGPLPAFASGRVTFGSFNAFTKVTGAVLDTWAALLREVPDSKLLMITVAAGVAQRNVREAFAARGIGAERLELCPKLSFYDYLSMRNRVDIALDPFPINGGTTTCESLWMGVPTITLAGRVFIARAGASLLTNAGLPELIARDVDDYVEIAAALASDLPRLAAMRAGLRERVRASPLCDAPRLVANLESLYREAWREWCVRRAGAA
jgi:protein O-GlcNAc transferase